MRLRWKAPASAKQSLPRVATPCKGAAVNIERPCNTARGPVWECHWLLVLVDYCWGRHSGGLTSIEQGLCCLEVPLWAALTGDLLLRTSQGRSRPGGEGLLVVFLVGCWYGTLYGRAKRQSVRVGCLAQLSCAGGQRHAVLS